MTQPLTRSFRLRAGYVTGKGRRAGRRLHWETAVKDDLMAATCTSAERPGITQRHLPYPGEGR